DDFITFKIHANPTTLGPHTATIDVGNDVPGAGPLQIALTMNGVTPGVMLSATTLDFGAVDVQGARVTRKVTLTNNGTEELVIVGATLSANPSGFFQLDSGGAKTLQIDESEDFVVSYLPSAM